MDMLSVLFIMILKEEKYTQMHRLIQRSFIVICLLLCPEDLKLWTTLQH